MQLMNEDGKIGGYLLVGDHAGVSVQPTHPPYPAAGYRKQRKVQ